MRPSRIRMYRVLLRGGRSSARSLAPPPNVLEKGETFAKDHLRLESGASPWAPLELQCPMVRPLAAVEPLSSRPQLVVGRVGDPRSAVKEPACSAVQPSHTLIMRGCIKLSGQVTHTHTQTHILCSTSRSMCNETQSQWEDTV